jgi:hypothetical protein
MAMESREVETNQDGAKIEMVDCVLCEQNARLPQSRFKIDDLSGNSPGEKTTFNCVYRSPLKCAKPTLLLPPDCLLYVIASYYILTVKATRTALTSVTEYSG